MLLVWEKCRQIGLSMPVLGGFKGGDEVVKLRIVRCRRNHRGVIRLHGRWHITWSVPPEGCARLFVWSGHFFPRFALRQSLRCAIRPSCGGRGEAIPGPL